MRIFMFILALAFVPSVSAAVNAVPNFNIGANCKAEIADVSGIGETLESCINDERSAKERLAEQWARFSKEDKTACIGETRIDGTPSYVELQACLEISSQAKARRGDEK